MARPSPLASMSMRQRIFGAFLALLLISGLIGLQSYNTIGEISDAVTKTRGTAQAAASLEQYATLLARMNEIATRFALVGANEDQMRLREVQETARSAVQTAAADLEALGLQARAAALRGEAEEFTGGIEEMVLRLQARREAVAVIFQGVEQGFGSSSNLSATLSARPEPEAATIAGDVTAAFNAAVLPVLQYARSGSPEDFAAAEAAVERLREAIDRGAQLLNAVGQSLSRGERRALAEPARFAERDRSLISANMQQLQASAGDAERALQQFSQRVEQGLASIRAVRDEMQASAGQALEDLQAGAVAGGNRTGLIIGFMVLIGLPAAWFIGSSIGRPIHDLSRVVGEISAGFRSDPVPYLDRSNEIGEIAKALEGFRLTQQETEALRRREAEAREAAEQERRTTLERLALDFDGSVRTVVTDLERCAGAVDSSASSISGSVSRAREHVEAVANLSEGTSTKVAAVAAAAEELSAAISEIGARMNDASRVAAEAENQAMRSDTAVRMLAETADSIGQVLALIQGIASQTNLLALNATIEAARAGEAGRGFAVVAQEVKQLATQTASATGEIEGQIARIREVAGEVKDAMGTIGSTVRDVNAIAAMVAAAVEEQNAATAEIARNIALAASETSDMQSAIGIVREAADDLVAVAGELDEAAGSLNTQSGALGRQADGFVNTILASSRGEPREEVAEAA